MERAAPWWPAVDALRGIAVAAVLLYHHDPDLLPGGFLGVSLFFTISGFLITTLVLREHGASGTIRLRRFWARRLRRLTPVALLGLVLALGVGAATAQRSELPSIGGDVRAAALDVVNWRFAADEVDYGDTLHAPSPVAHYWSLAIEEQFYAVFPVLAVLALRWGGRWGGRRGGKHGGPQALGGVLGVAALASIAVQLALDDPNRAYLGTDARAAELAVGALAAVVWQGWRRTSPAPRSRPGALDAVAVLAAAALLVSWRVVHLGDPSLFRGGLVVHAVLGAAVVVAAISGRWLPLLGRVGPLVALGRISYPVYVVHYPLFLWLDDAPLVARLAATVGLATAVHVAVERPVRWGGSLPGRQAPLAAAAALGAVLVLAVGVPRATDDGATLVTAGRPTVVTMPLTPVTVAAEPATTGMEPAVVAPASVGPPGPASPRPSTTVATSLRPPRLLVVGDSTGLATGAGMQRWASASGAAVVDVVGHYGCTFLQDGLLRVREGWVQPASPECRALLDVAGETAAATHPDAVVLFVGTMQLGDWDLDGDGTWRSVGDPAYDTRYLAAAGAALDRLSDLDVPVLWTDLPVPAWVPEASAGVLPGTGAPTINQPDRVARLAALTSVVVAGRSGVRVVEYARYLAGPGGEIPASTRPDGLHVDEGAVPTVMEAGFADALRAAYRELVAPGARVTTWSRSR